MSEVSAVRVEEEVSVTGVAIAHESHAESQKVIACSAQRRLGAGRARVVATVGPIVGQDETTIALPIRTAGQNNGCRFVTRVAIVLF